MKFFVYGTLKKNYGNNRVLRDSDFLGNAKTIASDYLLTNCGFPYAIPFEGDKHILGEVYNVTDDNVKQNLDWLEGNGHHYNRRQIMVDLNGEILPDVWIYEVDMTIGGRYEACRIVEEENAYIWGK